MKTHQLFQISIFFKGLDGVLQVIGAILAIVIRPAALAGWVYRLTQQELIEDPHDWVATHVVSAVSHFTTQTQIFAIAYLAIHGLIKILLVIALWQRKLWAYPTAIVVFGAFGIYQIYRYYLTGSLGMLLLTILDVAVIILTILEYKHLKQTA